MSRTIIAFGLSTILAAAPGWAATTATAVPADDDTIVVTATGEEQPAIEVGQSITVLTRDVIRTRQTTVVADLLATTPGVTVTRNGAIGGLAAVRIRGGEDGHTLVLIDGIRLNDPSSTGGAFDFGHLLVGNIARIEVLRGPNSVIWGSQALGGVIDIRTVEPTDALSGNVRAEYGYADTAELVGNIAGRFGPVAASVGAGYFRTDGISSFAGGTERDGYERVGADAKLRITLAENVELDLRGYYSDSESEIDGFPPPFFAFGDTDERSEVRELLGYAGLNATLLDGRFRNRLAYTITDIDRATTDFKAKGRIERVEYQGGLDVAKALTLVFGAEREWTRMTTVSSFGGVPPKNTRIDAAYGEAIVRPFAGLTLTSGLRYADHKSFGSETTFGANFAYTPNDGATVLRGTFAEGFKAPTLYQLFSEYGNDLLRPERAKSYDIGVAQRFLDGAANASLTYFRRKTRDQIDFVFCPSDSRPDLCDDRRFGFYENVARTRAEGVEFELQLRPVQGFDVTAQYTFIDTENRSPGNFAFGNVLARRPKHSVSVAADYRFPTGLSLGGTILHVGDSFNDAGNTTPLDGYVLVDLRASYPVTERIEIYGRVENLFDAEYRTVFDYGTVGRAAYGGVRLTF